MKKIASIVSLAALAGSAVVLVPACSASERTGVAPPKAATDAGEMDADAEPVQVFADVQTPRDAFNIFEASCATAAAQTSTDPVVLQFVLDGSGSMDSDNKWTAASTAIDAVFGDFLAKNDPKVAVGLIVFEDSKDPTGGNGPYPSNIDVYPQVVDVSQHAALTGRMNTTPSGGTPTYLALQGGYNRLISYVAVPPAAPAIDSRKVVILISDGVPSGGATEQAQCVAAAKSGLALGAPRGPIKTFSVGVGPFPGSAFSYDPKFMGDLAVAGGTRATPQCNPAATNISQVCHFQITPGGKPVAQLKQEFINAINRIRGLAVGCEFKIELGDAGNIDPTKINVVWTDGTGKVHVIDQDDVDGWTYDDPAKPTKVVLNGQSCGDVSEDLGSNIQIIIGCPTGIH